jgi:hypothetical protein
MLRAPQAEGQAVDLKDVHGRAFGDEFGRGVQGGAVVRGAPEASVRAVNNLAEALGMRAAVVLVPAKEEVYSWVWKGGPPWSSDESPSGLSSVLGRACAEEGLTLLDLKPSLISESRRAYEDSGQVLYWYDDTHLSAEGECVYLFRNLS